MDMRNRTLFVKKDHSFGEETPKHANMIKFKIKRRQKGNKGGESPLDQVKKINFRN